MARGFLGRGDREAQEALADATRAQKQAHVRQGRADQVVSSIQHRVYVENHVADAIKAFWTAGGSGK